MVAPEAKTSSQLSRKIDDLPDNREYWDKPQSTASLAAMYGELCSFSVLAILWLKPPGYWLFAYGACALLSLVGFIYFLYKFISPLRRKKITERQPPVPAEIDIC